MEKDGDETNPLLINMDEQPKEDGDKDKQKQLEEENKENSAKNMEMLTQGEKSWGKKEVLLVRGVQQLPRWLLQLLPFLVVQIPAKFGIQGF